MYVFNGSNLTDSFIPVCLVAQWRFTSIISCVSRGPELSWLASGSKGCATETIWKHLRINTKHFCKTDDACPCKRVLALFWFTRWHQKLELSISAMQSACASFCFEALPTVPWRTLVRYKAGGDAGWFTRRQQNARNSEWDRFTNQFSSTERELQWKKTAEKS